MRPEVKNFLVGSFSFFSVLTGCGVVQDIQASIDPRSVVVGTECKGDMNVERMLQELRLARGGGFRSSLQTTVEAYNNASCNVPDILAVKNIEELEVVPCPDGQEIQWRQVWDRIIEAGYSKDGSRNGRDVLRAFRSAACPASAQI